MDKTNARANLRRDAEPGTIASDCWRACSITGIVVANFISSNDTSDVSKPGVDLYLGDYVYAFEETSEWLRGFVSSQAGFHHVSHFMKKRRTAEFVQALTEKLQSTSTIDGQSLSAVIRCGIFPRSFIALHHSGQVKAPMSALTRHQTESSDEISELLAQTSGILSIWNDIAMEFFAQRNETKYDLARKQIVELSDLCKRLYHRHAITSAETQRLLVELKQCVRRGITLLESTVTVREHATFQPIDSAKVAYVQLYRMFNACDNGAVTNNSLVLPSENSIPSNDCDKSRPSVKAACFNVNAFNLRAQICEIKWSNFIISRNHQTSASSSIKTPSKSSLLPSNTSDSIILEFSVSLYDAKALMFVTEPVRHIVKVPLSNFLENENLFDAASVRMDLLFANLPFDIFSSTNSACVHIIVVVSRIFSRCAGAATAEMLPSTPMTPRKTSPISSKSSSSPPTMPPPPLPPGYGTADVTTSSPQQQHDYSSMKIALGCAVSYNLALLFNNSFNNLRKISREKLIATCRGMETLLSALPLFYFSLDVLPNKDKPSIAKVLQHILRQQKFASSPATLLYKMSNVSTLAPSSVAEGKNDNITGKSVLASSPSNLYVLQADSVHHMLNNSDNNSYWVGEELNFQALHADERQKFDFLLTWKCAEPAQNNNTMPNIARTLTLNKTVLPTESRREIFVTLESLNLHLDQHPILTAGISTTTTADVGAGNLIATLKHLQPNVEVLVSVCNDAGHVIENAIVMPGEFHNFMTSSNDSSTVAAVRTSSHFCSEVYWKNPDPEWHDTLQLSLSDRELASAHLRFIIRLRSKKLTKTTTTHQMNSSTTFREKLLNASTPKLKYFNITDSSTRNTNTHSPPSNYAASSAPLDKNDMILGVAYLPFASNQFLKSGINDLFIHRLVVASEQHFDIPASPHHQLMNGDFSSTAKRFFAKSRLKLFDTISGSGGSGGGSRSSRSNSVPRPLSSSTDGLSSLNDNSTAVADADRANKPPVTRQLSSKTSCSSSIANDDADDAATDGTRNCETPVPPPRHRVHSSATNVYSSEFDAAYLALPAKPPQQGSLAAAVPAASDNAVTKKVVEKIPRSPSVGGRMTFSPMSTFGRSSKKKLAGTPQVSVDLSAGEVVILENPNDAAPRAKSNSVHSMDNVAAELPNTYKSGPYATSSLERLKVRLHVCSTSVVQNRYLSTIINYSAASGDELEQCLKAFVTHTPVFVDFHQILQFLPDVLDALFGLLGSLSNTRQLELLCFRSILRVLASFIENDGQFRPCFDQYLNEQFYSPLTHRHLLGILQRIISKCLRDAEAEQRRKYAASQTLRRRITDSLEAIDSGDDGSVSGNLKNFLIRQRSSRASIFYLDFEVPEELAIASGESAHEDSNVASAVDSNKSMNVAEDAGINYFTILDEVIKQLPELFKFTILSYKQNQALKAQLNAIKHKNPNGAPTPPPRTRSRSSHKTSETKLPPVPLTPVRSSAAAAAEPELSSHVLQIVQSMCKLLSNMPSRPAMTTAETAVDTSEIIALCMPKYYTTFVLIFPDLLRLLLSNKVDCFSAELNLQLVLAVASIKFVGSAVSSNSSATKNFEILCSLRLQFLANVLPLLVPALLQECPTTFLKLVNVLCDAVVSKLAPTKECANMLMVFFDLNTKFDINQYAVPSSATNAVTFADILVLRLLIPVVDITLTLIMQEEEVEDQTSVLLDFVAVSMTLFGYSNTRTLHAVLTSMHCNISVPEASNTARSIILDKFLRLIGILVERNLLINERWLLLIMESCRCLARFLLHLGSVMKRQFLVALNTAPPPTTTDAKISTKISKRYPAAAAASLSVSDDGDHREDTDSCCNGTIVSGGGDVGSEIAEEEAGDEYDEDDEEEPIDVQLWVAYITSCVNLCTVDVLQLEQMFDYDNGRQFVQLLLNYGDMRITIVSALHALWYSFGRHRAAFMPSIVLPVLRLSLIPHRALRAKIIPLFFDMMQHEFYTLISVPYDVDDEAELLVGARRLSGKQQAAPTELYEQQQGCAEAAFNDDNAANFYESGQSFARRDSHPVFMPMRMRKCVKANFELFESEIIAQIDALFDQGYGDAAYVQQFRACMSVPLNDAASAPSKMFQFAIVLIERISQQLELLLRYREKVSVIADAETKISAAVAGSADVFAKMACTHAVMDFYDQIERHALYIRYLYRLRDLHLQQNDFTEIAFTLENHAKLLSWTDEPLSPQLQPPPLSLTTAVADNFDADSLETTSFFTHRQLKKHLLCSMIDCFEKSKLWEFGIQMCKELANVYEHDLYDYESLSSILNKQAVLFENIVVQGDSRPVVTYFYVGFWGNGYDEEFRNKHFIYRGANLESLGEFQQKMQSRFPHAQPLLTSMNEPSDDVKDSDKQFLQICRVEPVTDNLMGACCGDGAVLIAQTQSTAAATSGITSSQHHQQSGGAAGGGAQHVNWKIRKFYENNEISMFTFSKIIQNPHHSDAVAADPNNPFANMWLERTTYATKTTLPYLLRWSEVRYSTKNLISPCKNAVETVQNKHKLITLLVEKQVDALQQALKSLKSSSNLVVNARKGKNDNNTYAGKRVSSLSDAVYQNATTTTPKIGGSGVVVTLNKGFTQVLLGVLDAAVQGGIPKYEEAFLSPTSAVDPEDARALRLVIAVMIPVLEAALTVHEIAMYASGGEQAAQIAPMHKHLVQRFHIMRDTVLGKYGGGGEQREMPPILARLMKVAVHAWMAMNGASEITGSSGPAFTAVNDTVSRFGSTGAAVKKPTKPAGVSGTVSGSKRFRSISSVCTTAGVTPTRSTSITETGVILRTHQGRGLRLTSANSFVNSGNFSSSTSSSSRIATSQSQKHPKQHQQQQQSVSSAHFPPNKTRHSSSQHGTGGYASQSSTTTTIVDDADQLGGTLKRNKLRESMIGKTGLNIYTTVRRHLTNTSAVGPSSSSSKTSSRNFDNENSLRGGGGAVNKFERNLSMLDSSRLSHILMSPSPAAGGVAVGATTTPASERTKRRKYSGQMLTSSTTTTSAPSSSSTSSSSGGAGAGKSMVQFNGKKSLLISSNDSAVASSAQQSLGSVDTVDAGSNEKIEADNEVADSTLNADSKVIALAAASMLPPKANIAATQRPPRLPDKQRRTRASIASTSSAAASVNPSTLTGARRFNDEAS